MDESKNNVPSFIGKLALMLKDRSATPFVTWSQGGTSIVVIDPPTFATQVLPRCVSLQRAVCFRVAPCGSVDKTAYGQRCAPATSAVAPSSVPVDSSARRLLSTSSAASCPGTASAGRAREASSSERRIMAEERGVLTAVW